MHPMIEAAEAAVQRPEVQEMIRRLSEYGLGVFMPHRHDETTGEYEALPPGVTQVERNLQVTFEPESVELRSTCSAIGWRWDQGLQAVARCLYCQDTQRGHARFPH